MLDQRESAAACVVGASHPELAVDGGDAARDIAAATRVGGVINGPRAVGLVQEQNVVVVRLRVYIGTHGPDGRAGRREAVEVAPVGPAGDCWQVGDGPFPGPGAAAGGGKAVEGVEVGPGVGSADDRPRLAVVVRDVTGCGPLAAWLAGSLIDTFAYPDRTIDQLAKRVLVHLVEALDVQATLSGLVRS